MFKKIKLYLLLMVLTKRKVVLFAAIVVLGGIFAGSQSVHAFLDIPYNMANMQLNALDFIGNSVLRFLVFLALVLAESTVFLTVSALILDWSASLPIDIGANNKLVQAGWDFTSGLVNLVFILIFIAIALSYIFKMETFAMKKTLPRLIIVALLINFSLLFVQMAVDVGWVFQNSFKTAMFGNNGLAVAAMASLKSSALSTVALTASIPIAYTLLSAAPVPFLSVGFLVGLLPFVLIGEGLFGMFSQTILTIIFNFSAGLIFLVYTALFLARIGVVWLLAIVAPLAFAASILPQTEKYFKQWLGALIQWIFLGVVAFLLMGLGLKLFGEFPVGETVKIFGGWNFLSNYYKYIFLFVYLIVALGAIKKFTPMGAEAIWSFSDKAAISGAKWAKKKTGEWGTGLEIRRLEAGQRLQARVAAGEGLSWWQQRVAKPFAKRPELIEARVMALKGRRVQEEENELMNKIKGMDEETAKTTLLAEMSQHSASRIRNKDKTQALIELLAEKGVLKNEHRELYEEAWRNAGPEDFAKNRVKKAVLKKMLHWASPTEMTDYLSKANPADMEKLDAAAKANDEIVKRVVATMRSDLINRLGAHSGTAIREKITKEIENALGKKWRGEAPEGINDNEIKMLRSLARSSSFNETNLLPNMFDIEEIEERFKNFGKPPAPPKPPESKPSVLTTPGSPEFQKTEKEKRLPK